MKNGKVYNSWIRCSNVAGRSENLIKQEVVVSDLPSNKREVPTVCLVLFFSFSWSCGMVRSSIFSSELIESRLDFNFPWHLLLLPKCLSCILLFGFYFPGCTALPEKLVVRSSQFIIFSEISVVESFYGG